MIARAAWSWLLRLLLPLIFMRLWWRGRREPGYRLAWRERLGFGAASAPGAVWLHAVSLGETRAASALIDALRARVPGMRILLTHGTATGREAGQALLRAGDHQCLAAVRHAGCDAALPAATPARGGRADGNRGVAQPAACRPTRVGVPMVLANARLSERSARKGRTPVGA